MIHLTLVDQALQDSIAQPADVVIENQDGYIAGYHRIIQAIHAGKDLRVWVHDKTVGRWLKVLARRYGPEDVTLEELTLRRQLHKQIGIEVPEHVTDQQILDSGLLDLNIPASPNMAFEDYVLEVFFGNFLTLPGGLRRVGEIVTTYEPEQWQAALRRPLVKEIYQKKVRQLHKQLQGEGRIAEVQLLDWIDASPDLFLRNLSALRLLSRYPPSLGTRVLGHAYQEILKLKLDLRQVPVIIAGNEKAIDEIHLHLADLTAQTEANLDKLLSQVSGLLEIEFDSLQERLISGEVAITLNLVSSIQAKFELLRQTPRLAQALADLDLLISQDPPPVPEQTWQAEQWIAWATQDYLPYRFWLENTGRLDGQIGEIANSYADWLYDHYGQLLYNSDRMAWRAILDLRDTIKTHQGPVLVVLIDNLNAKFYPEFQAQMQTRGYHEQSLSYCFSMLPSCTEVSKKCLITGHYAPFAESAYQPSVEETWAKRLGKKVRYLGNIGDFRSVTQRDHDVYFLNYLPLDITLHQSERNTGISHAQAIRTYLASLAQDIRSFAQRIGAERDLMVIVSSDHGSTRIPKGTVNVIRGDFYKRRALDEHHRYIAVSDEELSKLPDSAKYDCYLFNRQTHELGANYLVARRLYRFLPTDENVYVHGGLTPEETLVPVAVYHPITVSPKPLAMGLLEGARLYVGTRVDLTFEITNVNNHSCDQVQITLPDPNVEAEQRTIETIPQLKRITITLPGRCPRTADPSAKKLHVRVAYRFLGQPWENHIELPIEIVEPARARFDLDDL